MKNAIAKQKNVLMNVKNGLIELEEAIQIITRTSWKKSEENIWKNVSEEISNSRKQEVGDINLPEPGWIQEENGESRWRSKDRKG